MEKKSKNVKNVNATIETKNVSESVKGLLNANLAKLQEKVKDQNFDAKERGKREHIYIYPSEWSNDQINGKLGKTFRTKHRKSIQDFSYNIRKSLKDGNMDNLSKHIEIFDRYYREFYRINDYSLSSLSSSKDESKTELIQLMLDIIKQSKG